MGYRRAANRDACLHGHPWPEHLAHDYRGWGYCRACEQGWNQNKNTSNYVPAVPDPAAIERAASGDPPARLTYRERAAAVQNLTRLGLSAQLIAERIGCSKRTVHRVRSRTATAA
ncbi:helix-turn-helix domain-containing protein [Streptomyces xanthophaeus]|uniref:helix-turn-helix domain-containing protein n=1 Tax=Streptomyces xanthophaeus TaxID=67385 RepID=UPI0039902DC8